MQGTSPARSDVAIRRARAEDRVALEAILHAAFAPYVPRIGRRPAPMDRSVADLIAHQIVLVAEFTAAAPIGFCAVRTAAPNSAVPPPGDASNPQGAELEIVAVDPSYQGHGIGGRLIRAAEEEARSQGMVSLALYTNAAMHENLRIYPKLGYRETGRGTQDGFERVYFEKRLPPPIALRGSVESLHGRRRTRGPRTLPERIPLTLALEQPADLAALFGVMRAVRLEVGFGAGEHLLEHARYEPDVGLIGVEPFETGAIAAARAIQASGIENIALHMGDARAVLDWLPAASLQRVDVLYPDPWPKRKHWKRRFVSMATLDRLARALEWGGTVRLASDIPSYIDWTRAHVARHQNFELTSDRADPWPGWPGTRYEAKARREGRSSRYLTLTRVG